MDQKQKRLSFELSDNIDALVLAQKIADVCGSTVTVSTGSGSNVGSRVPGVNTSNHKPVSISAIQTMANQLDTAIRMRSLRKN
jgi:hypothetical protein